MKFVNSLGIICICSFCCSLVAAVSSHSCALSVINKSGAAVQISYLETTKGPLLRKLVEQNEALTFGIVVEAMVSGVGVFGKYAAPEALRFFPVQIPQKCKHCIVIIEGAKNRSLTKPFGDWDVNYIYDKSPEKLFPPLTIPKKDKVIDAFPTAIRKGVPTSRFVLGLPDDAIVTDAIAAENLLSNKWLALKGTSPEQAQSILAIVAALNNARKAFELGTPDEVVSDLVCPSPYSIALAE